MVVHTVHKGCRYQEYTAHMKNMNSVMQMVGGLSGWVSEINTNYGKGVYYNLRRKNHLVHDKVYWLNN